MSSSNKTNHLSLNAWKETDRPMRLDFNSDNEIIDTALGEHLENEEIHLTYDEKMWLTRPYAQTSYVGDGSASRMITLPIVAKLVIIARENYPLSVYADNINRVYGTVISRDGINAGGAQFNSVGGVTVKENTTAENGIRYSLNQNGATYQVIAFR